MQEQKRCFDVDFEGAPPVCGVGGGDGLPGGKGAGVVDERVEGAVVGGAGDLGGERGDGGVVCDVDDVGFYADAGVYFADAEGYFV